MYLEKHRAVRSYSVFKFLKPTSSSAYLKRLVIDGKKVFLRSLNPKYADIPAVLEDSLRVLGRAL